jgi:Secretion system C-terminal sorting domain/Fibronectin type III domain
MRTHLPFKSSRLYLFVFLCLANFQVAFGACSLAAPTISASNITASSAKINWTTVPTAYGYELSYKKSTVATWTVVNLVGQTTATATLSSGLTCGTTFQYRVRARCSSVEASTNYAVSKTFTTLNVVAPTGLLVSNITKTGANIKWNASTGANIYKVEYKLSTATTWTTVTSIGAVNINLTTLACAKAYQVRVSAGCSANGFYSTPTAVANFTTLGCGFDDPGITFAVSDPTNSDEEPESILIDALTDDRATDELRFSTFPNPAHSNTNLVIDAEIAESVMIRVLDQNGSTYQTKETELQQGINQYSLDLTGLSSGLYSVEIAKLLSKKTTTIRLLKL